jgi:hypothetical protein
VASAFPSRAASSSAIFTFSTSICFFKFDSQASSRCF